MCQPCFFKSFLFKADCKKNYQKHSFIFAPLEVLCPTCTAALLVRLLLNLCHLSTPISSLCLSHCCFVTLSLKRPLPYFFYIATLQEIYKFKRKKQSTNITKLLLNGRTVVLTLKYASHLLM